MCDFPEVDLKIEGNRKKGRPKIAKPALMRSEPPNLPEIDILTIAPSEQPTTSSEQPTVSLEEPLPSEEVLQLETKGKRVSKKRDVVVKRSARLANKN